MSRGEQMGQPVFFDQTSRSSGLDRLLAVRSFEGSRSVAESQARTAMASERQLLLIWSDHRDHSERRLTGSKWSSALKMAPGWNGSI